MLPSLHNVYEIILHFCLSYFGGSYYQDIFVMVLGEHYVLGSKLGLAACKARSNPLPSHLIINLCIGINQGIYYNLVLHSFVAQVAPALDIESTFCCLFLACPIVCVCWGGAGRSAFLYPAYILALQDASFARGGVSFIISDNSCPYTRNKLFPWF